MRALTLFQCRAQARWRRLSWRRLPLAAPTLVLTALLFSVTVPAHAYIDPGAGPLLWQMFVAGMAGLAYQFSRWFRRGKQKKKTDDASDK